jgi:hypothetical protein
MLTAVVEIIVAFVLELLAESIVELGAELGIHALDRGVRSKTAGPFLAAIFYGVVGITLGYFSSIVFPGRVVESPYLRIGLMAASAVSTGLMLCLISWFIYRKDRNERFWQAGKFVTGVIFGAAYSLSRSFFVDAF